MNQNYLKKPVSAHKKYVCVYCEKRFPFYYKLKKHLLIHTKNKKATQSTSGSEKGVTYTCEFCNKSYCRKFFLEQHQKVHAVETTYLCNICSKEFSSGLSLDRHLARHRKKPYMCETCNRNFAVKPSLLRHVCNRGSAKPLSADSLSETQQNRIRSVTKAAEKVQENEMPEETEACKSKGGQEIEISQKDEEILEACESESNEKIEISEKVKDSETLESEENLEIVKTEQQENKPKITHNCDLCTRTFSQIRFLKSHVKIVHCEKNPFVCKMCNISFRLHQHLKDHIVTHSWRNKF